MLPLTRPLTRVFFSLSIVLFLVNAKGRAVGSPGLGIPLDEFSWSEPAKITTRHLSLDLTVDFARKRLSGSATLDVRNLTGTRTLILDTAALEISRVTRDGATAAFSYGAATEFGRPLLIEIEPSTRSVTIDYTTSSTAGGLHWATPAQTAGRVQPYLYTQNEPIDARSWFPAQDTPTVRFTYDATIRVPQGMLALMSAGDNPREVSSTGVYRFAMQQTIPAYLVALAVGRLAYHPFDERTGVYAEPELIEDAGLELAYMPEMLAAAERILGPHPFPRHDALLMPPTYIVGGMEHPMLNFISPFSVVTGNKPSRVEPRNLMAHELAHSWAGDATTLGSWNDVWINEGITSYLTQRIIEEMGYRERAEHQWFVDRFNYSTYAANLRDPAPSVLHRRLEDPNLGFSFTAYTKGGLFLRMLEDSLGRETIDRFLRDYFRSFAWRWSDDRTFVARLAATLGRTRDASLRLDDWIYGTRLPSNVTAPTSSAMYDRMRAKAEAFNRGEAVASLALPSLTDTELDLFLGAIDPIRLAEVDAALGLSMRTTPPLNWLRLALLVNYSPADEAIERVLMRGGPNGTITTVYGWLIPANRTRAFQIFQRARERYHPNVAAQVERMLAQQNATVARAA